MGPTGSSPLNSIQGHLLETFLYDKFCSFSNIIRHDKTKRCFKRMIKVLFEDNIIACTVQKNIFTFSKSSLKSPNVRNL